VFGQETASNNAAWLRRKLSEAPDSVHGQRRSPVVRARDQGAAIWNQEDGEEPPPELADEDMQQQHQHLQRHPGGSSSLEQQMQLDSLTDSGTQDLGTPPSSPGVHAVRSRHRKPHSLLLESS
jgi:hypothetical protein